MSGKPETHTPDRQEALALFREYNQSESLYRHALSVEAVMRFMAEKEGEDPEKWGVIGLVHDLDYEQFPDQHCVKVREILESRGWPEEYIHAVASHGWGICSTEEPAETMEKILFTIDELTGLVTAAALVRPSRSVLDITEKSVRKKWKTAGFAAGVDRSVIEKGAAMLGRELPELITDTILGMRTVAEAVGLKGEL